MYLLAKAVLFTLFLAVSYCDAPNLPIADPEQKPRLTVTYVGNEGVLISSGAHQLLIDGLHREYKPDYAFPPPALLGAMEAARSPYDRVQLLLVTHIHLDHFHPQSVGLHLQNNARALLVSSAQVADSLKQDFGNYRAIESRVKRITPEWKTKVALDVNGIKVNVLGLRHGSARFSWIHNLGYLIEVGGKKLLHIGDADTAAENFSSFHLPEERIDIAFIPYWYLLSDEGRSLVSEHIRPRQIIAVHLPPAAAESVAEQVRKTNPGALAFTKIGESKSF